jgi:hypothetical protein
MTSECHMTLDFIIGGEVPRSIARGVALSHQLADWHMRCAEIESCIQRWGSRDSNVSQVRAPATTLALGIL